MPVICRNSGWRPWFLLSAISLSMTADAVRGQGVPAPPPWNDLLKNELVVVGQYKSHKNGVMSLQVVDVLRGKTCKPGDILSVKFSQRIGFKVWFLDNGQYVERIVAAHDDKLKWPQMVFVDEQPGQFQESIITSAASLPHTYFFAKEDQVILERPDQLQPDRRRGWKQALEGKPIDLSFQILYAPDSEVSRKAIVELFKTRDRDAIAGLVETVPDRRGLPSEYLARVVAQRVLLSLGDRNGDVYDPVRKALKPNTALDRQCVLCQLLPRLDRQRALADFKEFLQPRSGVSTAVVAYATELESEEGLDLMFDRTAAGDIYAYGALQRVCFDRLGPHPNGPQFLQRQSQDMVQRAKMQDLVLSRMKKLLKNRALPDNIHSSAMMWPNFCFVVEEPPKGAQIWPLNNGFGFDTANRCPRRDGFPENLDWTQDDLEPLFKADLVLGRKLLNDRLAKAPKPGPNGPWDLLILQSLAHRYGDVDMVKQFKKPASPIVRVRHDKSQALVRGVPLSEFMPAFEDTLKLSPDYLARLPALFPEHAGAYFRELEELIVSEDQAKREFAIQQLEEKFFWNFDIDPDEYAFACKRKLEAIKPLLARLGRSNDILEMRGILLQQFGIKLEGAPGRAWLPAVEAAALRWNTVVHLNAMCVLGMIEEDTEAMRLINNAPSIREKVLQAHLKQRRAKKNDIPARTPDQLEAMWKDLDHANRATSYAAMQSLLGGRESTVAWLGKRLKQPGRDPVRDVRAIQVLEYMPGREARLLLEQLATGPEGQPTTHEAKGALQRLALFWRW
jgi:hypothetical protein